MTELLHQSESVREDLALVQRLLARDEAAWVEFVSRYDRLVQARIANACRETGRTAGLTELIDEISAESYAALTEHNMKVLLFSDCRSTSSQTQSSRKPGENNGLTNGRSLSRVKSVCRLEPASTHE